MQRIDILKKRQVMLKGEIAARLDSFLIGTIAKSPAMTGYGLTTKVKGKTVSLYVRKGIAIKAQEMNRHYNKMSISESPKAITCRFLRLFGLSAGSMECTNLEL